MVDINRSMVSIEVGCCHCKIRARSRYGNTVEEVWQALRGRGWVRLKGGKWLCGECCVLEAIQPVLEILELHLRHPASDSRKDGP